LTNKIFWFSVDYDRHREGNANLKVTGRRLDGDAPPLWTLPTTNALGDPYDAMLTGVYMPTAGCWEITGEYKGQKLSFVVWLYPVKQDNQWVADVLPLLKCALVENKAAEQIVGRERRERELIADFQLPIVDLNSGRRVNSTVRPQDAWLHQPHNKCGGSTFQVHHHC
jgi:hypothetical protein